MVRRTRKNPAHPHPAKHASPSSSQSVPGQIRIISGKWRGRKLPVQSIQGLRPTTDRVKETLFNWLMQDIYQARCLDLFAGSGSLGIEAASRGASEVYLVEKDANAAGQLTRNIESLKAEHIHIFSGNAQDFLKREYAPFDLVFLDPPFRQDLLLDCINLLESTNTLSPNALIYIETEKECSSLAIPAHWQLLKSLVAGQVHARLFQRQEVEHS